METKQYIALEVVKNDFKFSFMMPTGASWGNAIDSAFEVLEKLNELSQQSLQALKPADAAPEVIESEVVCQEGE